MVVFVKKTMPVINLVPRVSHLSPSPLSVDLVPVELEDTVRDPGNKVDL